ncbi:MAG: cell division protein FtsQ/DivIB [Bacteroidales bacterium]
MNSWKNIWAILKWVLLLAYLTVILSFVKAERRAVPCSEVVYEISKNHAFVDTTDIYNMLMSDSLYPLQKPLSSINLKELEDVTSSHQAVSSAEVYSEIDGKIHIRLQQRNPVLRIITESNMHYYVDDNNGLMSVGYDYTADVPVLSGQLADTLVMAFKNGNDTLKLPEYTFTMADLIEFAGFLYSHEMWRNQIVQVYIDDAGEFELIPRVGNHIIILGKLENYDYKLKKLEAMYKKTFLDFGWKEYKTINLKYSNQVVCSK